MKVKIVGLECDQCSKFAKNEREPGWLQVQGVAYSASPPAHLCGFVCLGRWAKAENLRLKEIERQQAELEESAEDVPANLQQIVSRTV